MEEDGTDGFEEIGTGKQTGMTCGIFSLYVVPAKSVVMASNEPSLLVDNCGLPLELSHLGRYFIDRFVYFRLAHQVF